ncbi:MAG: Rrf2 family transcriptional regulator [Desulfovibrionaceae bacterium]|nr:Rrf2 family transcriptional regulator [Desulfovibrionaceae bacterium]MBF0514578.1 Rrf2 family transcriptional regulator [Desulfovibrionaceae bacterium]
MRLTRAGEYAIRCVLYLSALDRDEAVSRREICEAMGIPHHFLGKIAQELSKAGLLAISQGARGGYRLGRAPGEISLLEVLEAVEGEIILNDCLESRTACARSLTCPVHPVWAKARDALRRSLGGVSFASLAGKETGAAAPNGDGPSPDNIPAAARR